MLMRMRNSFKGDHLKEHFFLLSLKIYLFTSGTYFFLVCHSSVLDNLVIYLFMVDLTLKAPSKIAADDTFIIFTLSF